MFARDWDEWVGWSRYRGKRDDFNRDFIFTVATDRNAPDERVFGGVFEVVKRRPTQGEGSYDIKLREDFMSAYIKRLMIHFDPPGRAARLNMENHLDEMTVVSILLEQISSGIDEHFDEEEAAILPIVECVITAAEYQEVGQRGLVSIPLTRRLIVLGYLLEDATPTERTDFLAAVPAPARLAHRLIGVRQHRHETTRLPAARYDPEQTAGPEHRPVRIG